MKKIKVRKRKNERGDGGLYILSQTSPGLDPITPRFKVSDDVWVTKVFSSKRIAKKYLKNAGNLATELYVRRFPLEKIVYHVQVKSLLAQTKGVDTESEGHVDAIELDNQYLYPLVEQSYEKVLEQFGGDKPPWNDFEDAQKYLVNHLYMTCQPKGTR